MEHLAPLKTILTGIYNATETVKSTKAKIESQGASAAAAIDQLFNELHDIIEQRKQEIVKELSSSVNHQLPASINYRPSVHRLSAHRFSELYGTITDKHGLHFDLNYWPYCTWAILGTFTWPKCHVCRSSLLLCRK